jgi:hypothetical protein
LANDRLSIHSTLRFGVPRRRFSISKAPAPSDSIQRRKSRSNAGSSSFAGSASCSGTVANLCAPMTKETVSDPVQTALAVSPARTER